MYTTTGPFIIAALAGLSAALFVAGLFLDNRRTSNRIVHRRVEEMRTEVHEPLDRSFAARMMQPFLLAVLRIATSILPTRIVASINEMIEAAGRPMTVNRFLTIWLLSGVGLPLAVLLLFIMLSGGVSGGQVLLVSFWVVAGLYLPWVSLRRKVNERTRRIARDLPDAIDLIITNLEAGLGMQAALLTVSTNFGGPLAEEFSRVVREISLGGQRTQVLTAMSERTGVAEMRLFVRAIIQAEQTGIPVARVLRNHAAEIRTKRQQRAREQAAKIPVKIIFPTVMVMFPTLFLVILGPVVLNMMNQFGDSIR